MDCNAAGYVVPKTANTIAFFCGASFVDDAIETVEVKKINAITQIAKIVFFIFNSPIICCDVVTKNKKPRIDYSNRSGVSLFFRSPMDGLFFSAYFDSEPGDGERNTTLGGSVHWEIAKFIIDGEYIGALNREKHYTDDTEYKEAACFASIGFQVIDPLIFSVRYEDFDDGKSGNQDEHMDHRYSFGVTYTLFEQDTFVCNLLGEYRKTEFEHEAGGSADRDLNEFFVRLAFEF